MVKIRSLSASGGSWGIAGGLLWICGALHGPMLPLGSPFGTPGAPKCRPGIHFGVPWCHLWVHFWSHFSCFFVFLFGLSFRSFFLCFCMLWEPISIHFGIDFPPIFLNGLGNLDTTKTLCLPIRSRVGRCGNRPKSIKKTKEKTSCDRRREN